MNEEIGLQRGTVVLKKHHVQWANAFEFEKQFLKKMLGDVVIDIQHIGSTAVQGLAAKPIIDMLMAIESLRKVSSITPHLENAGYTYRENGSDGIQMLFVKGPEALRTHYLHITPLGSSVWQNAITFRDYLRNHPDVADDYQKLKESLASTHASNREKYTSGKSGFIHSVLKIATKK